MSAPLPTPLISAEQLRRLPFAPTLLDVRWELGKPSQFDGYAAGHIPGAVFVDLDSELAGPPGVGGRHPLPAARDLEASMRTAGVSWDTPVVAYDAASSVAAARAWWLLRYFGHEQVAVLDGGLSAWVAEGGELETGEIPAVSQGDFVARPGGMPLLDADSAASVAAAGVLLDARAPERFRGEVEPVDPVAGHIPGAHNVPSAGNVDPEGRFRPAPELQSAFSAAGVRQGVGVGAYCGSGVSAAHEVLALELAGFSAALYVGSWSDWIGDPGRPVARE